jgi:hypothetical protein
MTPADPMTPVAEPYLGIHEAIIEAEHREPPGVLFIGDSITDFWRTVPWLWDESFGKFHPVNAGIAFDQTQHVIWRIQHGELDGIKPRVVVMMIGTNNLAIGHDDENSTKTGIFRVGGEIMKRLPDAKLLLLGTSRREKLSVEIHRINADLAAITDDKVVPGRGCQHPAGRLPRWHSPQPGRISCVGKGHVADAGKALQRQSHFGPY